MTPAYALACLGLIVVGLGFTITGGYYFARCGDRDRDLLGALIAFGLTLGAAGMMALIDGLSRYL